MSTYVSNFYSKTVFQTANELEVHTKLKDLIEHYLDSSGKFSDPDFGPTESDPKGNNSIFYPIDESVELQGDHSVGELNNIAGLNIDMIQWLRPNDFCKDPNRCSFITLSESESEGEDEDSEVLDSKRVLNERTEQEIKDMKLLNDKSRGASSLDVMQGNLGDCWFISGMVLIAIRDDLFGNLICENRFPEFEKYGLYVFRMFRNCKVHYIVVDDKVPCMERSNGQCIPAFARNRNPNEFWVSLIEKAYAKLNIRYINLTSGFIDEALQDLSGLAPEMIRFNAEIDKDNFWQTFRSLTDTNSLIGASLNFLGRRDIPEQMKRELQNEARHHGIQYGHAYGVLDVREVPSPDDPETVYKFLRVKNPWGKENSMEWNGDWCDNDERWTEEMRAKYNEIGIKNSAKFDKEEMTHVWGRNDNIFIMAFEDFLQYFNTLMAVRDFPDEWSGIRYYTAWSPSYGIPPKGKTWFKNPQYVFHLKKTTQVSLRLQQPDPRSIAENRPPFKKYVMLIVVFRLDPSEKTVENFDPKKIVLQSQGADSRSVMIGGDLKPGKYCVVLFNAVEGAVCDAYFSFYFNCAKDDIVLENKNWEVIREEEEVREESFKKSRGSIEIPDASILNKSVEFKEEIKKPDPIKEDSKKPDPKKEVPIKELPNKEVTNKEDSKKPDPKIEAPKKEETKKQIEETRRQSQTKLSDSLVPGGITKTLTQKKEELVKVTAFGKTVLKPASQVQPAPKTYSQALKDLKSNILETAEEEENRIVDPLAKEIQFETDLAVLFGLNYRSYKDFYAIPTEHQEKIIEEYNIDRNRTATVLDLSYFLLGNKGLRACFGGIEDYPHLEYLYLKGNRLGDTVICDLCRVLELSRQIYLKEIDLNDNPDIGDTAALALISLSSNIKSIYRIGLDGTAVTVKVLQKINELMARNKKLSSN